ncbi:MAG: class I SAM-dependent methyltransferase [Spirochaetales bacterium]|nr:class I SAM-dependent methyltransferase [Spirochaetales bacterium]
MYTSKLPIPDENRIIRILPINFFTGKEQLFKKFNINPAVYDFFQEHIVRPFIHKAHSKQHYKIIKSEFRHLKNKNVLDIACGTGSIIKYLDASNCYTGLDISYSLLKKAAKKIKSREFSSDRLIQGTAEDLPFKNNSFDFVCCNTALHMIPDFKKAIQEISRVLGSKGYFFGCCPVTGINDKFDLTWNKIVEKRKMINSLNENDIKNACEKSGLTYKKIGANGGLLYFKSVKS